SRELDPFPTRRSSDLLVKISGHMLRQGFMGSDFSYEDALESRKLLDSYDFTLEGTEPCGDAVCYVLEATARPGSGVAYARRKLRSEEHTSELQSRENL